MSVDDFLGASFMEEEEVSVYFMSTYLQPILKAGEPDDSASGSEDGGEGEDGDDSDDASFASVDELEGTLLVKRLAFFPLTIYQLQTKEPHTYWNCPNSLRRIPSFSGISKKTIASFLTSTWRTKTMTTLVTTPTMLLNPKAIGSLS